MQMTVFDTVKDYFIAADPDKKLTNLERLMAGTEAVMQQALWAPGGCLRSPWICKEMCMRFVGVCAGAASIIVTYPMENLRTHVSLGRKGGYFGILGDIYREHVGWLCMGREIRCIAILCCWLGIDMASIGHVSISGTALQGLRKGVYGGFAPCMLNTVTTVGLGFFGYDFGVEYYKRYIMDKPRNPTPGKQTLLNASVEAGGSPSCSCGSPAACLSLACIP
jgi:hypothetical protein